MLQPCLFLSCYVHYKPLGHASTSFSHSKPVWQDLLWSPVIPHWWLPWLYIVPFLMLFLPRWANAHQGAGHCLLSEFLYHMQILTAQAHLWLGANCWGPEHCAWPPFPRSKSAICCYFLIFVFLDHARGGGCKARKLNHLKCFAQYLSQARMRIPSLTAVRCIPRGRSVCQSLCCVQLGWESQQVCSLYKN